MKKILVIDDDHGIRQTAAKMLFKRGYAVLEAPEGEAGLELARCHLPNLVLCDIGMNHLNGYDVLKSLRSHPATATIPVILMTGAPADHNMRSGMNLGADDYLSKPFTTEALCDAIQARLNRHEVIQEQAREQERELLREVERAAKIGGWELDPLTNQGHWTDEVARIHDLESSVRPNRSMGMSFYHGKSRTMINIAVQEAINCGKSYDLELEIVSATGKHKWIRTICRPIVEHGKVIRLRGSIQDISDRKLAEKALQQSEEKSRALFENARDAKFIFGPDGRFLDVNREACERLQYTRDELLRLAFRDIDTPENAALMPARIQRVLQQGHILFETVNRRKDGSLVPVEMNTQVLEYEGQILIMATARDLTERRRAETALRDSEEKYRGLFESSHDALLIHDPTTGRFSSANPAALRMFGAKDEAEVLMLNPSDLSPEFQPDGSVSSDRVAEITQNILREGHHNFEWMHRRINGGEFVTHVRLTRMELAGKPLILSTIQDITERKRVEESLRAREESFRALADNVPDAVARLDRNFRFIYGNRGLARDIEIASADFIGKTRRELKLPMVELWERELGRTFETGKPRRFEFQWPGPKGICHRETRLVPEYTSTGEVEFVLAVTRDIGGRAG